MENNRDIPRSDNRRPRRKKRKKGAGGHPEKDALHQAKQGTNAAQKRSSPQRPAQDRRKESAREKGPKTPSITATPRDLRLGTGKKDKSGREEPPHRHITRRYGVAIYDSFAAAKADKETIAAKAKEVDQLNLVIRAEGNMDDPEILALGPIKIFAGSAWTLIHERRIQDGWYDTPR